MGVRELVQGDVYAQFDRLALNLDGELMGFEARSFYLAKAVGFLISTLPNLTRLDLTENGRYGNTEEFRMPARRAELVRLELELASLHNPQPIFFKYLQMCIDFQRLETLSLPDLCSISKAWLDKRMASLLRLTELHICHLSQVNSRNGHNFGEFSDYSTNILLPSMPLRRLTITGGYNYILWWFAIAHIVQFADSPAKSPLERLYLHENYHPRRVGFRYGIEPSLLGAICHLKNLTFLDIEVHRSEEEFKIWRALQSLGLKTLKLMLDCTAQGDEQTFDNKSQVLKYAATDKALARSIYDVCGPELLTVTTTSARVAAFEFSESKTTQTVLRELTASSYRVRRVEDQVDVREMFPVLQTQPSTHEAYFDPDYEIIKVFRGIWPSQNESWKEDWHCFPISINMRDQ